VVGQIAADIDGVFDELYIVYNEFKSAIQQRVIVEKLFPVDAAAEFGTAQAEGTTGGSYLYERTKLTS